MEFDGTGLAYYSEVFNNIISNELFITLVIFGFVLIGSYTILSKYLIIERN